MIIAQVNDAFFRWDWVFAHLDDIWDKTFEHLKLTGIAVGLGLVIAMGLALLALRYRRTYGPITWVAGILYTIPSLALFTMLVPLTGLSVTTAEIGLVSYTLLILIRNIVAGIDGVSNEVRDAAIGMGYTRRRLLVHVELPLALPVIVAGIRIATVTIVGLVTVTALIGQGGLGFFILRGLTLGVDTATGSTQLLLGAGLSVALAAVLDMALLLVGRLLTPWTRARAAS